VALHPQVEEADGVGAHGDGRGGGGVSPLEAGPVEGDALVFHGDDELAGAPQKDDGQAPPRSWVQGVPDDREADFLERPLGGRGARSPRRGGGGAGWGAPPPAERTGRASRAPAAPAASSPAIAASYGSARARSRRRWFDLTAGLCQSRREMRHARGEGVTGGL